MNILAPSILAADFAHLGEALAAAERAGAQYVHLDIMDGSFVPNISIGPPVVKSLRKVSGLVFDAHLMIQKPERYVKAFADAGADIICFHIEATESVVSVINQIKDLGKKAAVAIKPQTAIQEIFPYADKLDMALIMSVEPGFGGQMLMPEALEKARVLRRYAKENNLELDIEMDGGICLSNLKTVLDSGVNVIVAGTDVFGAPDVDKRIKEYLSIL